MIARSGGGVRAHSWGPRQTLYHWAEPHRAWEVTGDETVSHLSDSSTHSEQEIQARIDNEIFLLHIFFVPNSLQGAFNYNTP